MFEYLDKAGRSAKLIDKINKNIVRQNSTAVVVLVVPFVLVVLRRGRKFGRD